jgi:hypothetical protein
MMNLRNFLSSINIFSFFSKKIENIAPELNIEQDIDWEGIPSH